MKEEACTLWMSSPWVCWVGKPCELSVWGFWLSYRRVKPWGVWNLAVSYLSKFWLLEGHTNTWRRCSRCSHVRSLDRGTTRRHSVKVPHEDVTKRYWVSYFMQQVCANSREFVWQGCGMNILECWGKRCLGIGPTRNGWNVFSIQGCGREHLRLGPTKLVIVIWS